MARSPLGSKVQRAPGVWTVRVSAGRRPDGSRRWRNATVRGSERDADLEIMRLAAELHATPASADGLTLADYWPFFLARCRAKGLTNATLDDYGRTWANHVGPALGAAPLASVGFPEAQALALGKTNAVGKHAVKLLRRMLSCACDDGLVAVNPLMGRRFDYRVKEADLSAPPAPLWGVAEVLEAAERLRGCPLEALWLALVGGGLRVSEGLALWWSDVETVPVSHSDGSCGAMARVTVWKSWTPRDGLKGTKTPGSVRMVPVPDPFASRLAELELHGPRCPIFPRRLDRASRMWAALWRAPGKRMSDDGYMGDLMGLPRLSLRDMRAVHETLMQEAGTLDTLNARLHGRSDVRVGYAHYLKPQAPAFEAAAEALWASFRAAR